MAEITVYGSASDGSNYYTDKTDTYLTAQEAVNASGTRNPTADNYYINNGKPAAGEFSVERGYLYFDLSAMAGGTITAITAYLNPASAVQTNDLHPDLWLVEGVQADPYTLANYGDHLTKTTKGHDTPFYFEELVFNSYSIKALNATAIAWAQAALDGSFDFKLCIRTHGDIEKTEPSGQNYVELWSTDKGGDYRPKLVFTYTPPVAVGRSFGFIIG